MVLPSAQIFLMLGQIDLFQLIGSNRVAAADIVKVHQRIAKLLDETEGDVRTGVKIVLRALEEPVRQIAANAGLDGSVICEKIKNSPVGIGYDALNDQYVDMFEAGIVDPAKVTRSALQNAASVSSTLLTTEAVVTDIPEKEAPAMPQQPMY